MSSNFEQARREGVNKEKHSIICNCGLLKPLFIMFKIIHNELKKTPIFFISVRYNRFFGDGQGGSELFGHVRNYCIFFLLTPSLREIKTFITRNLWV